MDIVEFAEKVLEIKLSEAQKEVLKEYEKGHTQIVTYSVRMGKATIFNILKRFREKKPLM